MILESETDVNFANKLDQHFDEKIEKIYNSFANQNNRTRSFILEFLFNKMNKFKAVDFSEQL